MSKQTKTTSPSDDPEVKKLSSTKFMFRLESFTPDLRAYKPSTPVIKSIGDIVIQVLVPVQSDLIVNAEQINVAELTNQKADTPILTPLGMRYIIDQFEAVMGNGKEEQAKETAADDWEDEPADTKTATKEEDWEEETETKSETKKSDDDWDDEEDTKETKKDEDVDFDKEESWED